jgi:hypothetical protein
VRLTAFSMASDLRIGIDFDNTIVTYDDVFCAMAKRWGLIEPNFSGSKQAVRDEIRLLPDGELAWQRLQGQVYGKGIKEGRLVAGVESFLRRCKAQRCVVAVVSHKTEYGHFDPDRVNLREAALDWMTAQGLFDRAHAIAPDSVYFENTREKKLQRIAMLSLTHFIDDLEEVLGHPEFPPNVQRILFADDERRLTAPYLVCSTWRDIERRIFEGASA